MTTPWNVLITTLACGALWLVLGRYLRLWLQAYVTGTDIRLLSLIFMSLRRVDPKVIVRAKVMAVQAGLTHISTDVIEAQYLAGGDVHRVTLALISAHRASIDLDWNTAAAIDLAGRDILEAVQVSVTPKVIHCPQSDIDAQHTLDAVAQDGIQLKVRVFVTVRTNLSQLIGGATEATVIARVGQGIVSAIGGCETYRQALTDPARIVRQVMLKGLDSQTCFSIVSIDIADIDVGSNIGAQLRLDQAHADIRIARATAEKRRAMAIARQQEMLALTREHEALLALAEADIPPAIATAFRRGQLRVQRRPRRLEHPRSVERSVSQPTKALPSPTASVEMTQQVESWESEGGRWQSPTRSPPGENR